MSEFGKLCVVARCFADRAFDRSDVGNLRTNVEVNKFEAMAESRCLQCFTGCEQAGSVEPEFCIFATARRPFARTLVVQPHANADVRLNADLF